MTVAMSPVKSSNIESVGYDAPTGDLHVKFKSGGDTYVYHGVPAGVPQSMLKAESIGSFLQANVRGKFKHTKQEKKPQS